MKNVKSNINFSFFYSNYKFNFKPGAEQEKKTSIFVHWERPLNMIIRKITTWQMKKLIMDILLTYVLALSPQCELSLPRMYGAGRKKGER